MPLSLLQHVICLGVSLEDGSCLFPQLFLVLVSTCPISISWGKKGEGFLKSCFSLGSLDPVVGTHKQRLAVIFCP